MNQFSNFLNEISSKRLCVLDKTIPISKYIPLDLSSENTLLQGVDVSSFTSLESFINIHIKKQNGLVAYGGYNELRDIYKRSRHFNLNDVSERNIHIGLDLWREVDSPVYAPLNATVHSFKNNLNYGDYGPTIILKHTIDNIEFYTLYGHLSLASIENLKINQVYNQGDQIGTLGDATVNGDYPPHLHFQIIKNIQDYQGDYPGVSSKKDLNFYLKNCPDPNLLLKLRF
ncbi:peptidoglycan DD-metalloendopeptidase family protein [Yeosuana sp.]|uniref:peptidoglycan DD-metalloendopeptidase family protein n=1 Tax=Yeosuana sp. TaxID=2529388 RepID=UPI004054BDA0